MKRSFPEEEAYANLLQQGLWALANQLDLTEDMSCMCNDNKEVYDAIKSEHEHIVYRWRVGDPLL